MKNNAPAAVITAAFTISGTCIGYFGNAATAIFVGFMLAFLGGAAVSLLEKP